MLINCLQKGASFQLHKTIIKQDHNPEILYNFWIVILKYDKKINSGRHSKKVIQRKGFSRNVRNEIKNEKKVYFYDCGIRNAIINDFKLVNARNDVGVLWENFVVAERMKSHRYNDNDTTQYFWGTTQQQEIDLIEEKEGKLSAYEFKWNKNKKVRFPSTFTENYPGSEMFVISPDNIEDFLLLAPR